MRVPWRTNTVTTVINQVPEPEVLSPPTNTHPRRPAVPWYELGTEWVDVIVDGKTKKVRADTSPEALEASAKRNEGRQAINEYLSTPASIETDATEKGAQRLQKARRDVDIQKRGRMTSRLLRENLQLAEPDDDIAERNGAFGMQDYVKKLIRGHGVFPFFGGAQIYGIWAPFSTIAEPNLREVEVGFAGGKAVLKLREPEPDEYVVEIGIGAELPDMDFLRVKVDGTIIWDDHARDNALARGPNTIDVLVSKILIGDYNLSDRKARIYEREEVLVKIETGASAQSLGSRHASRAKFFIEGGHVITTGHVTFCPSHIEYFVSGVVTFVDDDSELAAGRGQKAHMRKFLTGFGRNVENVFFRKGGRTFHLPDSDPVRKFLKKHSAFTGLDPKAFPAWGIRDWLAKPDEDLADEGYEGIFSFTKGGLTLDELKEYIRAMILRSGKSYITIRDVLVTIKSERDVDALVGRWCAGRKGNFRQVYQGQGVNALGTVPPLYGVDGRFKVYLMGAYFERGWLESTAFHAPMKGGERTATSRDPFHDKMRSAYRPSFCRESWPVGVLDAGLCETGELLVFKSDLGYYVDEVVVALLDFALENQTDEMRAQWSDAGGETMKIVDGRETELSVWFAVRTPLCDVYATAYRKGHPDVYISTNNRVSASEGHFRNSSRVPLVNLLAYR